MAAIPTQGGPPRQAKRRIRQGAEHHYTPAFLIGPTGGALKPLLHFALTEPLAFEEAFREALAT
jgi:hypothetical protein